MLSVRLTNHWSKTLMTLAYRTFKSSEEFEQWQEEDVATIEIVHVQPIISGANIDLTVYTSEVAIFVVYQKRRH